MRNQNFGIEIEMTGLTRAAAAQIIAGYFNTTATHVGGGYDSLSIPVSLREADMLSVLDRVVRENGLSYTECCFQKLEGKTVKPKSDKNSVKNMV